MSSSLAGPAIEAASRTGRQQQNAGSRAMVYVIAAMLALVAGAATVIVLMRVPESAASASGEARPGATDAALTAAVPTGPTVVPAQVSSVTVTVIPSATASASAAPSTGASSITSGAPTAATTASVPVTSASGGAKKWGPKPKKTSDPLDRR